MALHNSWVNLRGMWLCAFFPPSPHPNSPSYSVHCIIEKANLDLFHKYSKNHAPIELVMQLSIWYTLVIYSEMSENQFFTQRFLERAVSSLERLLHLSLPLLNNKPWGGGYQQR